MLACLHVPKNRWLLLCRMYSELISAAIASGGPHASRTSQVKLMRSCKKVALKLIETFVEKCDDTVLLAQQIVPAMMDPILGDYARNVPDARSALPPAALPLAQMLRGPSKASQCDALEVEMSLALAMQGCCASLGPCCGQTRSVRCLV